MYVVVAVPTLREGVGIVNWFCCCFYRLLQPSEYLGSVPPDSDAIFELFDRVINVKLNLAVPFGLRGTVIGIHQGIRLL